MQQSRRPRFRAHPRCRPRRTPRLIGGKPHYLVEGQKRYNPQFATDRRENHPSLGDTLIGPGKLPILLYVSLGLDEVCTDKKFCPRPEKTRRYSRPTPR